MVIHCRLGLMVGDAAIVLGSLKAIIKFQNMGVQVRHLISDARVDLMTVKGNKVRVTTTGMGVDG